jgi:hypothetical protein
LLINIFLKGTAMTDIVFASVPLVEASEPIMPPGLLKSIAEAEGFTSIAIDLNVDIWHWVRDHSEREKLVHNLSNHVIDHDIADELHMMIKHCAEQILAHNPTIVGLSLLSYQSQVFTVWLAFYLKDVQPDIKIIIGGSGIKNFVADIANNSFCETLKKLKLIDHYIMGDGEIALKEFLHGNLNYPGIDSVTWIQPTDISNFPHPNYTDYDFTKYDNPAIPITDSRGCVRACEFCDIIEHWKKFVYRSAESLFDEMLHQIKTHNIKNFNMMNSLTNGNMKEFSKWLDLIVEYNKHQPQEQQISWKGYFIVREAHQHPEELWDKLKKSNGLLVLGVESVIEHVRWNMKKKFTNKAIDYHLEMARKYQVPLNLLLIVGSPEETYKDYEFTKQWFRDRVGYAKNSVQSVILNFAAILPGTEWSRKKDQLKIISGNFPSNWIKQDQSITPEIRLQHFNELAKICEAFTNREFFDKHQRGSLTVMTNKNFELH